MSSSESDEMSTTTSGSETEQKLPPQIEDMITRVRVGRYAPTQTSTLSYHSSFEHLHFDNSFSFEKFKKNFKVNILSKNESDMVFEMTGIDAPLANAFRRIMLSDIPTMAIEKVIFLNNTSIIQDEVFAHRIGLVPILAEPDYFYFAKDINQNEEISAFNTQPYLQTLEEYKGSDIKPPQPTATIYAPSLQNKSTPVWRPPEVLIDNEYILFELNVTCEKILVPNPHNNNKMEYKHSKVYSGDLKWIPIGNQAKHFASNPIRPVYDDILLAKLNPGQSIHIQCYCVKGVGRAHAKWQPVATATYRLRPEIVLKEKIKDKKLAKELKEKCPMNVFDIEDNGSVTVARPLNCTMCRECIREDDWDKRIQLSRLKDHFIFSIESVGVLAPEEIFRRALRVFWQKCALTLQCLRQENGNSSKNQSTRVLQ
ncbi:hypothetical protein ABK040_014943 [Willaertia magna]